MSFLKTLDPNGTLAAALDKKVAVITKETASGKRKVRAYRYGNSPSEKIKDEFIVVGKNGITQSLTEPLGLLKGNIQISVYCKLLDLKDGQQCNHARVQEMLSQIEALCDRKVYGDYFYRIAPDNVIVDTTPNLTNGYSTTIINVEWHVTNREKENTQH